MGPAIQAMLLANSITVTTVLKLSEDLLNWPIYEDQVQTAIESKTGLSQHLAGMARQLREPALPAKDAKDDALEKYDKAIKKVDEYNQREATIK